MAVRKTRTKSGPGAIVRSAARALNARVERSKLLLGEDFAELDHKSRERERRKRSRNLVDGWLRIAASLETEYLDMVGVRKRSPVFEDAVCLVTGPIVRSESPEPRRS